MIETVIVILIVAGAAAYLVRRFSRSATRERCCEQPTQCACEGCAGCEQIASFPQGSRPPQ